jgi:hypothetical protein
MIAVYGMTNVKKITPVDYRNKTPDYRGRPDSWMG